MKDGKWITDVHTHSTFSHDGVSRFEDMLETARKKGVDFYGVAEHFNHDTYVDANDEISPLIDVEAYFHTARHLQEDYAGVMNVLVGAEFGYTDELTRQNAYVEVYEKYRPDFVVNSIHSLYGVDYYFLRPYYRQSENGERVARDRLETYREYLAVVRRSLDATYPYDIVGHIGYAARYAPYQDKEMHYAGLEAEYDDILKTIIKKDKILEVNGAAKDLPSGCVPARSVLERYYALGGRKISYASDAHSTEHVARRREEIVKILKEIGFTYLTVPCRGEHIKVDL